MPMLDSATPTLPPGHVWPPTEAESTTSCVAASTVAASSVAASTSCVWLTSGATYSIVTLPHESVSRQHCAILHDEDTTYVVDLGSAHGTYVDGVRLTADEHLPLRDGALLSLGSAPVGYRAIIRGTAADQAAKKQKK